MLHVARDTYRSKPTAFSFAHNPTTIFSAPLPPHPALPSPTPTCPSFSHPNLPFLLLPQPAPLPQNTNLGYGHFGGTKVYEL